MLTPEVSMTRRLLSILCLAQLTGCGSCISHGPAPPIPMPPAPVPISVGPFGRFDGRVLAEWDIDGRFMTLREKFAYVDSDNKAWLAPSRARRKGASIPE